MAVTSFLVPRIESSSYDWLAKALGAYLPQERSENVVAPMGFMRYME